MAAGRMPPTAPEAELALLGSALLSASALNEAIEEWRVQPDDFYTPIHATLWATILAMHANGSAVDVITVAEVLREGGDLEDVGGMSWLNELMNMVPSTSRVGHYATAIRETAIRRRLIGAGAEIVDIGYSGSPIDSSLSGAEDSVLRVARLAESLSGEVAGLHSDADVMMDPNETIDERNPWVIPGLLRVRERMIVVAGPGAGKSTFLRQLAHCAANAVHPYTGDFVTAPEQRTMIVELEAQVHNIVSSTRKTRRMIAQTIGCANVDELQRVPVLHRPEGLNVRDPADRSALIEAIRRYRPQLVCIGPLKYMYGALRGETFDETAVAVQRLLNSLMVRYDFAIVIEAHASKSEPHKPSGSERWVDWPDVGFALTTKDDFNPFEPMTYDVDTFRHPRNEEVVLPVSFIRNHSRLPWFGGTRTGGRDQSKTRANPDGYYERLKANWCISSYRPIRSGRGSYGLADPEVPRDEEPF